VPGGESLAGVCAGRRSPKVAPPGRRCAATLSVASTTLRCAVVAYFLNAGSLEELTARRRHDRCVPQQADRRRARQVTRSAGVSDPVGCARNRLRHSRGGSLTPQLLSRGVGRRRQTAPPRCEAAPGRLTASTRRAPSCTGEAIESEGRLALLRGCGLASTGGTKASQHSVPSFVPPPAVIPVL